MIIQITLLSNGNIAPNKVIPLGKKYESVGDKIEFIIPDEFKGYNYYLTFAMKKQETILLPVNVVNGDLLFTITTTITKNAGTYEMVFLATEDRIINGDINGARKIFVSKVMSAYVENNFLTNPIINDELDENLQIIYDDLYDLYHQVQNDLENDVYRGAVYIPDVDAHGNISWTRNDGKDINIPTIRNITGPQGIPGGYYMPTEVDGVLGFDKSVETMPDIPSINLNPLIESATNTYLDANVDEKIDNAVDSRIQFSYDEETKTLYITTIEK